MRHIVRLLLPALVLLSPAAGFAQGRITVTGVGEVARAPDMATLSLGAAFEAETAVAAMDLVGDALAATLAVLADAGVPAEDIQTRGLSLSPVYPDRSGSIQRPAGAEAFRAESSVTVIVRDLDALGPVLDAVLAGGANRFGGLSFGLQDPGPAEDAARVAAVADATRKARLLAEAAGLDLGPVQLIQDQGGFGGPMPMAELASVRGGMPIAEGQLTVQVSIAIEWELVEDLD